MIGNVPFRVVYTFQIQDKLHILFNMEASSLPVYTIVPEGQHTGTTYFVLTHAEAEQVPETHRPTFLSESEVTHVDGDNKTIFLTPKKASKTSISSNITVRVSVGSADEKDYLGSITDFLVSAYKFSRKQKKHTAPVISVVETTPDAKKVIILAETKNQTREWGNGRGDVESVPQFFQQIAESFAKEEGLDITVISGDDLLKQGFRLMHAVGRASVNKPVFVNIAYRGNPDSDEWTAFVGKGICFDTGGLNIKTTAGMLAMFLDKCGAVTVLSAFKAIVKQKLRLNLTCTIGLAENSINENAYRPSDIIASRKGLTVEIGNTDAEGRLVLADCMNWVQEKFKVKTLIELSTLTGAIITALGHEATGFFTNSEKLFSEIKEIGERVHELSWHMPCTDYHKRLVSPKHCDLTNSSGKTQAGSSQAAAFLKSFVEQGTTWAHLDIAGTAMVGGEASGWGSRLLVEYARSISKHE